MIEYRPVSGVPNDAMPALYGEADVVVDQFRIGNYGVAACEAMAAGASSSHVDDQVRSAARDASGLDVPIVEATPDTLSDVLRRIAGDREAFREVASRGPRFVDTLHGEVLGARARRDARRPLTNGAVPAHVRAQPPVQVKGPVRLKVIFERSAASCPTSPAARAGSSSGTSRSAARWVCWTSRPSA